MGIFANLKLRRKLLFAMAPLAMMAILAAAYSSIEIRTLDDWYSQLVDRDWRAVHHIDIARALNMRYGFYLYRLIVETDPDQLRVLDAELDSSYSEYRTAVTEAMRLAPAQASKISAAASKFDKAVLDSRPVRAAALANDNSRARALIRAGIDAELQQAVLGRTRVDRRSEEFITKPIVQREAGGGLKGILSETVCIRISIPPVVRDRAIAGALPIVGDQQIVR